MTITFECELCEHETQCIVLYQTRFNDASYVVSVMLFDAFFQHYSTPSWSLPFCLGKFFRKGQVFQLVFLTVVFISKPGLCSKFASLWTLSLKVVNGIQFTKHFIESVFVETTEFFGCNPNV